MTNGVNDPQFSSESLMYQILKLIEEINEVARKLTQHADPLVGGLSLPRLSPSELGFLRSVSWLYVHYYEISKINIEFLTEKLPIFGDEHDLEVAKHKLLTQKLRTYSQHNLNPNEPQNQKIRNECEQWFATQCGTPEI